MSRKFQGAHEVSIPIEAILQEYAAWSDEITDAVANELLREVRAQARRAFISRSGKLYGSIRKKKSKFDKDTKIVGAFWPTAHLIEGGHDIKVSKDGAVLGHVAATPFLGPAALAVQDRLPQIVNGIVAPTIEVKQ